jgi:hypothetical protein
MWPQDHTSLVFVQPTALILLAEDAGKTPAIQAFNQRNDTYNNVCNDFARP